ncbi:MAG: response regulator [Deltaproteobacteria bacterium]|nr:response regulator [Deltaproteobacteria bacterium]
METNRRILVIDDDPGIQDAYRQILSPVVPDDELLADSALLFGETTVAVKTAVAAEYELSICSCGEEGIAVCREAVEGGRPFALAFIDMKMPGLDGAATAREIWRLDAQVKIVIVTAFSDFSPDEIVAEVGREDLFYLNKPFNQGEIKQFTRALLDQWNINSEKERLQLALEKSNHELRLLTENLEDKVKEQTALLIQSEKMASVGILAAGVAHEINNPAAFVGCNLNTIKRYSDKIIPLLELTKDLIENPSAEMIDQLGQYLRNNKIDFIIDDMVGLANESIDGIRRISSIVADLKSFSHIDRAEISRVDLNLVMDTTLNIIHNELKYKVEVVKDYGTLPEVECFPQKISQVFMNLLINAAQAITEKGLICITTRSVSEGRRDSDRFVEIEITDSGQGIEAKHLPRLFDPFFTTKPVGQGTGLGLSIVYDIIKGHGGSVRVKSEPGKGTTFTVTLLVNPPFSQISAG